jgi:hypothetical protein
MNLNEITFKLTRASIQLKGMLSAGDIIGAREIADEIYDLMLPLGEATSAVTDILNERNTNIAAQKAAP